MGRYNSQPENAACNLGSKQNAETASIEYSLLFAYFFAIVKAVLARFSGKSHQGAGALRWANTFYDTFRP